MGLFSFLFGKKKTKAQTEPVTDGQEKYFKESAPKRPAAEEKAVKNEAAPAPAKARTARAEVVTGENVTRTPQRITPEKNARQAVEVKPVSNNIAKKSAEKIAPKTADKKAPTTAAKPDTKKPAAPKAETKKPVEAVDTDKEDEQISNGSVEIESKTTRSGKFDIRRAKDGRFYFSLYASNKAVIAYSQMYSSSTAAITGIKSVISNASKAQIEDTTLKTPKVQPFPKWEIYLDKAGQYRFRLYASNGNCVCHSHGYAGKTGCKGGIDSITRIASETAAIDKSYLQ